MDHDQFQDLVIEKLTRLETHMEDLMGNGQPGRMTKVEEKVESLSRWRWIIAGAVGAGSAIIHFIFKY